MGDGVLGTLAGPISGWPGASHEYVPPSSELPGSPDKPVVSPGVFQTTGTTINTWRMDHLRNPRTCRLRTDNIPTLISTAESPILTLQDFRYLMLEVEYEKPVLQWDWEGPMMTTRDQVRLSPCFDPSPGDLLQNRRFKGPNDVSIETSFYWPPSPKGPTAGYTAPLARWVETRIAGYTSEPIVLRGYYSQTYRPEHHNFSEHFLFEPQLEPGLPPAVLAELREKDIRLIHMRTVMDEPVVTTYGYHEGP